MFIRLSPSVRAFFLGSDRCADKDFAACALNGGRVNTVQCFTVDPELGLVKIANSLRDVGIANQSTPGSIAGSSSQVTFSADGSMVHVAVKGTFEADNVTPNEPGRVATWMVNDDGTLSTTRLDTPTPAGALRPFAILPIANTSALLSADAFNGAATFDFQAANSTTRIAGSPIALTQAFDVPGKANACWVKYSKSVDSYFLSDFLSHREIEVKLDPKTLNMRFVANHSLSDENILTDIDIATVGGKEYVFCSSKPL